MGGRLDDEHGFPLPFSLKFLWIGVMQCVHPDEGIMVGQRMNETGERERETLKRRGIRERAPVT